MKLASVKCYVPFKADLKKIEGYLLEHGWKEESPYGEFGRFFRKSDLRVTVLVTTEEVGDFRARIEDLVIDIALAEDRSVLEVIKDLESWEPKDVQS